MTTQTGAADTQAVADTQPPAGSPPTQADGGESAASTPEFMSLDEARKLRSEANSLRKRLKEIEDARTAADEAKLNETERAAKRIAELERKLVDRETAMQERTVLATTEAAASRLGFANPRLAHRLLDHSLVEYDEGGMPTNVEVLLKGLLKSDPYLAAKPNADFGGGNQGAVPNSAASMNDLLRRAARGG